ncbi:hypothetical protein M514_07813, partial [Trichuris suis]
WPVFQERPAWNHIVYRNIWNRLAGNTYCVLSQCWTLPTFYHAHTRKTVSQALTTNSKKNLISRKQSFLGESC